MANVTDPLARSVHGTDPQVRCYIPTQHWHPLQLTCTDAVWLVVRPLCQNLVENILRKRIYNDRYWKESCFALTGAWQVVGSLPMNGQLTRIAALPPLPAAETLIDKAIELEYIGSTYGGAARPTPFICLVLKMLQIQPDKEIIVEFIKNDDYKYVATQPSTVLPSFPG